MPNKRYDGKYSYMFVIESHLLNDISVIIMDLSFETITVMRKFVQTYAIANI